MKKWCENLVQRHFFLYVDTFFKVEPSSVSAQNFKILTQFSVNGGCIIILMGWVVMMRQQFKVIFFSSQKFKKSVADSLFVLICNKIETHSKNRFKLYIKTWIHRPTTTREKVFNFVFPGTNKRRSIFSKTWVWVLSFSEWTQMEQGNCKMHQISVQLKVFFAGEFSESWIRNRSLGFHRPWDPWFQLSSPP